MNAGKTILAALVGGVVYFLLGWAVWGVALASVFALPADKAQAIQNEPMGMVAMFLSCLTWAGVLAYIFARWAKIGTFATGAVAGATIAVLVTLSTDLGMLATYNFMTPTKLVVNVLASAATSAVVGGVVGWMLGRVPAAA